MTYPVSDDTLALNPALKDVLVRTEEIERGRGVSNDTVSNPERLPNEADFATAFDELAEIRGWTWCGFRPARIKVDGVDTYRTPVIGWKGCPDRILARAGRVLLVEFKSDTGKLSKEQQIWAESLSGFPGYHIVRPRDWVFIERLLK